MKNSRKLLVAAGALFVAQTLAPVASAAEVNFNQLIQNIRQLRQSEQQLSQQREGTFRAELQKIDTQAKEQVDRRNREEARSNQLSKSFDENEARIAEMKELLAQHQGNLGELFGVTRQVAGDSANVLASSMLNPMYGPAADGENRVDFMRRIADAKALPSITELERLWFELHREMTATSRVARFEAPVYPPVPTEEEREANPELPLLGEPEMMSVTTVGPFTATANGEYLTYMTTNQAYAALGRQLHGNLKQMAEDLERANGNEYVEAVVDPSRDALLRQTVDRPNVIERIENGEVVGWVIVAVGILGVVVAVLQAIYLVITRIAVGAQVRNMDKPTKGNPLGRVILAFRSKEGGVHDTPELAELRISEAVLKEVPKLERFQGFLRLAVAAGPLLGLVGTVIGMIITFHAITASGSSDPKLMAHGIGQAMIATVLGLGIAIPLLFINSGLATLSRGVTQILDERSHTLLADTLGKTREAA
ncbi:MAG: MotA/TolQ/ExbB proton channel family protein [Gammaproteobacteria bacterium]|nr:MotA/TolQ/ExbB proton channel family protein [Gammaproteobacteria bacterium]